MRKFWKSNLAFFIILTAVVFIIYGKTVNYQFTKYDDDTLISRNINFISDFKNIPELFTTSCFYVNDFSYYRPCLTLSFALESIFAGKNIKLYHLTNILLFILSIYLMYIFLIRLNQNKLILKFICLIIAVHPAFSSCIAWIPARNDTILAIFIFLSFISLTDYINSGKNTNLLTFLLYFTIALFTKETSLILIPAYVFFIYIFKLPLKKQYTLKILPGMFFIIAVYLYLRTISTSGLNINIAAWQQYSADILNGTMIYLYKFLIPDYIPVMLYNIQINPSVLTANIIFLSFLLLNYYKKFIRIEYLIFGLIWLLFWLLPTFLMNDYVLLFHRFLLPSAGLALLFSEFVNNIILKYGMSKKYFITVFIILFGTYSYASYMQADKYKNSAVYWANAYSDAPAYHVACHGIAKEYMEIKNYEKALEFLSAAEKYSPNTYLLDIAAVFLYQQKLDEAEKLLLKSIKSNPFTKDLAYGNLSKLYLQKNDVKKALYYAQAGYYLNKNDIEFSKLLITVYKMNNEFEKALNICFKLLKHDKTNAQYYYTIGVLYEALSDYKNALKFINEGLKFAPENIQLIEKNEYLKNLQK